MDFEGELSLNDYINIVKRRFLYALILFFLLLPIVVAYALWLPPVYESYATVLIKSQQVTPAQTVEVFAEDRFAALKQIVLSSDNLFKIAQKYKLYGLNKNANIPRESLVAATRANVNVSLMQASGNQWGANSTYAFNISFTHYNPKETYDIANDLVKLFLDENEKSSKESANETTAFYFKEVEVRKGALEKIEKELADFKLQHSDSLPENKEIYVGVLERLENDLKANQLEYRATLAELRSLDVSLESAKAGIGINSIQQPVSVTSTDIDALKFELAKQKSIYNDNHPSVRLIQRRIDALEKTVTEGKPAKPVTQQSVLVDKVQAQIDTANERLKSLGLEETGIRSKIRQAERSVLGSAQTEGVLNSLLREYENAKSAYSEIKSKLDASKMAKNIEMENKGLRFVLSEAPVLPEKPIKPNRLMIIFVGFIGSILASICFVIFMEMFDTRVSGVDAIVRITNTEPIATIPYIVTNSELRKNKRLIYNVMFVILFISIVVLMVVHNYFMPLGDLFEKIVARF